MAARLGLGEARLEEALREGLVPEPTHVQGRRLCWLEGEVQPIRQAYARRYDGLLTQIQMAEILHEPVHQLWSLINRGIMTAPGVQVGSGRRRYYRLSEVERARGELGAWKASRAELAAERASRAERPGDYCSSCGLRSPREGFHMCENCQERDRRSQKARRQRGVCSACRAQAAPGRTKCEVCARKATATACARILAHEKAGLCLTCNSPAPPGKKHCEKHLKLNRLRARRKHLLTTKSLLL